jgi:peptidyl-prolyl cis-trans isomerase D
MLSFFRRGVTSENHAGRPRHRPVRDRRHRLRHRRDGRLGGAPAARRRDAGLVGGEKVTSAEVTDQVNRQLDRAREQQPELDMATFLRGGALRGDPAPADRSEGDARLRREQGFAASKRMIDGEIASIPAFQNLAGQFDQQAFQRRCSARRSPRSSCAGARASLIQRQILLPGRRARPRAAGMAQQYASLLLEQRSGTVGLVPAAAMGAGRSRPTRRSPPSTARTRPLHDPERRVLRYAAIGPEQVAAAARPPTPRSSRLSARTRPLWRQGDADAEPGRASRRGRRRAPSPPGCGGGTSFAQAAQQAGFGAGDIASASRPRRNSRADLAAVANAAPSRRRRARGPAQSPLGWHIVRGRRGSAARATPLAAVRPEIERQLAQRKRRRRSPTLVTRIEDALGEGELRGSRRAPTACRSSRDAAGHRHRRSSRASRLAPPPELAPLLKAGFEMDARRRSGGGDDRAEPALRDAGVGRVVPAAPPPLAQIATG